MAGSGAVSSAGATMHRGAALLLACTGIVVGGLLEGGRDGVYCLLLSNVWPNSILWGGGKQSRKFWSRKGN